MSISSLSANVISNQGRLKGRRGVDRVEMDLTRAEYIEMYIEHLTLRLNPAFSLSERALKPRSRKVQQKTKHRKPATRKVQLEASMKDVTPIKKAIHRVYELLYSSVNSQLSHNGASAYAEITEDGVTRMINKISTGFMSRLTKSEASAFRAIDLGAGYLTCLAHIAQAIPGEYVGIEYCPRRSSQFAHSYGALLAQHSEELCNTKIAYAHMNILDLHSYECDLVYTFDEAFPYDVWKKIVETFVKSHRCKFLIMFKVAKASRGYKALQAELLQAGVSCIDKLCLKKKGGESSNAMFFVKSKPWNQGVDRTLRSQHCPTDPCKRFWEKCKEFWGSIEMAKTAVAELMAETDQLISTEKKQRKR
jgi:hypothetical protein